MASNTPAAPHGKLSLLPLELRTQIHGLVLNFNDGYNYGDPYVEDRAALLRTSKAIYDEAIVALVNANEFAIFMRPLGKKKVGSWSWELFTGFRSKTVRFSQEAQDAFVRRGLLKEIRIIDFNINFVSDSDLITDQNSEQTHLLPLLGGVITELSKGALKCFHCNIRSLEKEPGNFRLLLDLISTLRGLTLVYLWAKCLVYSRSREPKWQPKREYIAHLESIMKLPKGVEAPKWVPGIEASDGENVWPCEYEDEDYRIGDMEGRVIIDSD